MKLSEDEIEDVYSSLAALWCQVTEGLCQAEHKRKLELILRKIFSAAGGRDVI